MNAKQGFHWKLIEEKPDNWEKLQILIQDAYLPRDKEEVQLCWTKTAVLEIYVQLYPEMKKIIGIIEPMEDSFISSSNKKISNKDKIKLSVEKEKIKKDLLSIKFNDQLKPISFNFQLDITFVLMIMLWCHKLLFHKNPLPLYVLDATISINRLIDNESNIKLNPSLKNGIEILQKKMNLKMTTDMYHLLFQNPIYLIQSTAEKRKKQIKLYKEQMEIIEKVAQSIEKDEPLLVGNQMPTGTGKTFLAVPLAQKIQKINAQKIQKIGFQKTEGQKIKIQKTLLFACSNELVTQDIAATALLGDDLHLWLSKLIRDEKNEVKVLLRPYKRCFSDKWKTVYKKENIDKIGSVKDQWNFYIKEIK